VKKASEYRQHAAECRILAASMELGEDRDQLLEIAATWESLANERLKLLSRHPELATDDERDGERNEDAA
jgi:hypothetical protein